jgi:hypothetical protein
MALPGNNGPSTGRGDVNTPIGMQEGPDEQLDRALVASLGYPRFLELLNSRG